MAEVGVHPLCQHGDDAGKETEGQICALLYEQGKLLISCAHSVAYGCLTIIIVFRAKHQGGLKAWQPSITYTYKSMTQTVNPAKTMMTSKIPNDATQILG